MNKKLYIIGIVISALVLIYLSINKENNADNLFPVSSFSHSHGLAVGSGDSNKLYIATHEGLYVLLNDTKLYQIGKSTDDYMGFSAHPSSKTSSLRVGIRHQVETLVYKNQRMGELHGENCLME